MAPVSGAWALVAPRHVESSRIRDQTLSLGLAGGLFLNTVPPGESRKCIFMPMDLFIMHEVTAAAKSLQLCPTLCDPIDGSLPGSSVPGILQARILEWVAISFSNA